jgi:hypothetical protein
MRSREFDAKEKLSLIFSLKALSISLGNNPTFSLLAKSIILPGLYFSTGIEFVFHIYSK